MDAGLNEALTNQFYSIFEWNLSNPRLWKFSLIIDQSSALWNIAQIGELHIRARGGRRSYWESFPGFKWRWIAFEVVGARLGV